MRDATRWSPLAHNKAKILGAVCPQPLIKGDGFAFTISDWFARYFRRCFPLDRKTVRDCAKIMNPRIDRGQGDWVLGRVGRGIQNWFDPLHLAIIWRTLYRKENGLRKAGYRRQGEERGNEGENAPSCEGGDAY